MAEEHPAPTRSDSLEDGSGALRGVRVPAALNHGHGGRQPGGRQNQQEEGRQVVRPIPEQATIPEQAETDAEVARLWLYDKAESTRREYTRNIDEFFACCRQLDLERGLQPPREMSLRAVTVRDLVGFGEASAHLARSTVNRKLAAVKSLLTYAHQIGYLPFNPGKAVKLKAPASSLSEKILSESEVHRILGAPGHSLRNQVMLRLFYASACRVSEICALTWKGAQERPGPGKGAGQITVVGKGDKARSLLLSRETWHLVLQLQEEAAAEGHVAPSDAVFWSQKGGHLHRSSVWRVIRKAAREVGIAKDVSPHWMRHAAISHALDRGAPMHRVQQDAGHKSLATTSKYAHARPGDSAGLYLPV